VRQFVRQSACRCMKLADRSTSLVIERPQSDLGFAGGSFTVAAQTLHSRSSMFQNGTRFANGRSVGRSLGQHLRGRLVTWDPAAGQLEGGPRSEHA
jgi:hypothetical protein